MLYLFEWLHKIKQPKRLALHIDKDLGKKLTQSALYLVFVLLLHTLAMRYFENMAFSNALWLTLTSVTTVGYGDYAPTTHAGRIATVLLIYFGGIFVLAKVAGDYFDYRNMQYHKKLKGEWRWHMHDHIVIIAETAEQISTQYFQRLQAGFAQIERYQMRPMQLLTAGFKQGLPEGLQHLGMTYYHGYGNVPEHLQAVDITQADYVIVLANDHNNALSDANTFDIIHRIRELSKQVPILAECVDDKNRGRLQEAGATSVVRPIRAYPEMIVRAVSIPGSEKIMEDIFSGRGSHYQQFKIQLHEVPWSTVVSQLIQANMGTALAYIDTQGELHFNPSGQQPIHAQSLIVMLDEYNQPSECAVQALFE